MDVTAYSVFGPPFAQVKLGAIAESIWTDGFKRSQERTIQVSRPINSEIPNLFDRSTMMEDFQFAASQSFADIGTAVIQMGTWPDQVPTLAHVSFTQGNQTVWLGNCGIKKVDLVQKKGVLLTFGYSVIAGAWSKNKPF